MVAFSWWGVNLLGVGLHSYGFTSGIQTALTTYYGVQGALVLTGIWALWRERRARRDLQGSVANAPVAMPKAGSSRRAA